MPLPSPPTDSAASSALTHSCQWLEQAVIGLNLCPFAKGPYVKGQIRWVVSPATTEEALLKDLEDELLHLVRTPIEQTETTLLIHPHVLNDFMDFNDFLDQADGLLDRLDLVGTIQIANFHPQFQFAGTDAQDITNYTNRSPWPTLHLIREASIDRAVAAFPEAETIYETNMQTMRDLGHEGWQALFDTAAAPAPNSPPNKDTP